jgi:palmitoyltransferase
MAISFIRLFYVTTFDPPYVPLGADALSGKRIRNKSDSRDEEDGIAAGEYDPGSASGEDGNRDDLDSPGLEHFYTKEVFVCRMDGRPSWCHYCSNWKPDRAHHCSSSGRCVLKMDHFCPWVGGPVGENNLKFFIQFTGYTALYCIHILVVMAIYIRQQKTTPV